MKNPLKMFCENPQIFWQSTVPYISFLIATIWIKPTLLRKNEKKNYIDIFILCGEIHLYAFFFIFSQKNFFDTKFLQEKLIFAFFIIRMDKKRTFLA